MATFDVLQDPWIPVVTLGGERCTLGLLPALERAHELRDVVCESPLETYAVQRMMIAFLMDAYTPQWVRDRVAIFQGGRFDPAVFTRYAALCRSEGVSFDLFDKSRPFMQAPFDEELDAGKEKPAANLFHALPTGNNHIHFDHRLASGRAFTAAECLRGILACNLFSVAMTGGYPSSVNDTPCYYALLEGNNLFETLVLSMLSKGEFKNMEWDQPKIAWRDPAPIIPKSQFADVSVLGGLTWQPRRITLIPSADENVYAMRFQPGRSFHQNGRWQDPHVSFARNKDGEPYSLKPRGERAPWLDVGVFSLSSENAASIPAAIIRQSQLLLGDATRRLHLFGLTTNKAAYEDWIDDRLSVPGNILMNFDKAGRLRLDVDYIESTASLIRHTLTEAGNAHERSKDGKKKPNGIAAEAVTEFFSSMHTYLFSQYMDLLASRDSSEPLWEQPVIESSTKIVVSSARSVLVAYMARFGSGAKELQIQTDSIGKFQYQLNKSAKERLKVS